MQLSFNLISHQVDNVLIHQREVDGYVNASAICKASEKDFLVYLKEESTQNFIKELSDDLRIPQDKLVIKFDGGTPELSGVYWVHPNLAIHLGQWCSPKFAVRVTNWVMQWKTNQNKTKFPYHIKRYMANLRNIPTDSWCMLGEMTISLIGPLEARGYTLPEHMLPDISTGRMFCSYLRSKGIDTNTLPTYKHMFEDGRIVKAKLYPNWLLSDFREYFSKEWLPKNAERYFKQRDPDALPYLADVIRTLTNSNNKLLKAS